MPGETAESVIENGANVVPDSVDVAQFAALLKDENASRISHDDKPEAAPNTEQTARESEPSKDLAAIRAAFDSGDVAKLAELLGADPKSTKIAKSQWVQHRIATRRAKREIEEQRAEFEKERAQVLTEKEQLGKQSETLTKAKAAVESEDYAAAIELLTGKTIDQVIDALAADFQNPSNREIRRLRRETEATKAKFEFEQQALVQQREQTAQQQAAAQYVAWIKSEIAGLEIASPILNEYSDEFVNLVFQEVGRRYRANENISTEQATRAVLRTQLAAYDRGKQIFEDLREALGQSGTVKSKSAQGNQGARLSPRKPTTSSQGGAAPAKPMTEAQEIAFWAKQLKAENSARISR